MLPEACSDDDEKQIAYPYEFSSIDLQAFSRRAEMSRCVQKRTGDESSGQNFISEAVAGGRSTESQYSAFALYTSMSYCRGI
jgi:hypothetical protein